MCRDIDDPPELMEDRYNIWCRLIKTDKCGAFCLRTVLDFLYKTYCNAGLQLSNLMEVAVSLYAFNIIFRCINLVMHPIQGHCWSSTFCTESAPLHGWWWEREKPLFSFITYCGPLCNGLQNVSATPYSYRWEWGRHPVSSITRLYSIGMTL